jgi:hypothetical protein
VGRPTRGKGCILLLGNNVKSDSVYGVERNSLLISSIDRIYTNYNDVWKDDVRIAHTGDFDAAEQAHVIGGRAEVSFLLLEGDNWSPHPSNINDTTWFGRTKWGMGYRHMCRFFGIRIWPALQKEGYRWVMRFDDDSYLLSPIRYNIFGFMEAHNLSYGYRNVARDLPHGDLSENIDVGTDTAPDHWFKLIRSYVAKHRAGDAGWLLDACWMRKESTTPNSDWIVNSVSGSPQWYLSEQPSDPAAAFDVEAASFHAADLESVLEEREPAFTYENCGIPWGIYDNFFVADIDRFMQPDVQHLLQHIDDTGNVYKRRLGDLSIHSAIIQIIFGKAEVHHFTGWGYAHNSGVQSQLNWGVVQMGRHESIDEQVHRMMSVLRDDLHFSGVWPSPHSDTDNPTLSENKMIRYKNGHTVPMHVTAANGTKVTNPEGILVTKNLQLINGMVTLSSPPTGICTIVLPGQLNYSVPGGPNLPLTRWDMPNMRRAVPSEANC